MVVLKFALYTLIKCNSALEQFQQFLLDIAVVVSLNYNAILSSLLAVSWIYEGQTAFWGFFVISASPKNTSIFKEILVEIFLDLLSLAEGYAWDVELFKKANRSVRFTVRVSHPVQVKDTPNFICNKLFCTLIARQMSDVNGGLLWSLWTVL